MTADTTMTDVDTSRANINRIFDKWRYRFGKDRELLGMIEALAAERDELERLAGEVADDVCEQNCPQKWKTVDGQKHSEICKRVAAYQRKGE